MSVVDSKLVRSSLCRR